ncbi:HD domain-containing protein [Streptococcus pneumoniae]
MNEKVFRDPIHNYVHVDHPIIYELINSKEFQRLRRIKQLGTSGYTFHGGEHSRFSHCLGAYEIARRIVTIFEEKYPNEWDKHESLLTMTAALLHDVGHGAYSHTFERLFDTDHEEITRQIMTQEGTEIHQILAQVAPDFPDKVASVIHHTYPNKQVVQLISSQIDVDRMDYLLRDSYFTGANYGQFDLTRILRVIRPIKNGIAFQRNGMHAVEDYVLSRYQMYMQVYFHPASHAMEVLLQNLLKRAKVLYPQQKDFFLQSSPHLIPFFEKEMTLADYLALDDGVMNTYFQNWMASSDKILSDLAQRFINRKVLKSIVFSKDKEEHLQILRDLVSQVGFEADYYTAIHRNFDLPYDVYHPNSDKPRTQIEILQKDGELAELSSLSPLVKALAGTRHGDNRFYFPKEMLSQTGLFSETHEQFMSYIHNETFIYGEYHEHSISRR